MRKRQKEAILVTYFKEIGKYKKLAEYIMHLVNDDPSAPHKDLYTIIYRIKDQVRLLEKIDNENKQPDVTVPITFKNFQQRIGDLLGIRVICLRLSDIKKFESFLNFLAEEKVLRFIEKPAQKRSFILPVDPGESIPADIDLGYSGYSSIHYQVELGENSDVKNDLKGLQFELQLRTILEEAWGEIDHKYRYVLSRSGIVLPKYIHSGFYNLSAYLQVAALQAEYLCRQAESYANSKNKKVKEKLTVNEDTNMATVPLAFQQQLDKTFGFKLSTRTLAYLIKRLEETQLTGQPQVIFQKVMTEDRLEEFKNIFRKILDREAFKDTNKRNIDAINAVNFALSDELQGSIVAQVGLKAILKWREKNQDGNL